MESILYGLSKDLLGFAFKKLPWQVVAERLATRILSRQLNKLTRMNTNRLTEKQAQDIAKDLQRIGLPKVKIS
ncbi:conserved hypothetical protein [Vibrio coralliirubri]|uniref:hypothetical protein n=1 Tax=Vibrio coralliirubri TaxID=1516159 RepID=UPI000637048D|nr:hypothetical protein [Vibrio coralliirubri]CDT54066.1 conserved hypothetical protein [Vibrio coralliirubri]